MIGIIFPAMAILSVSKVFRLVKCGVFIGKTTNTFKLSLTPSTFGDEAVVSLTGVADAGTAHTFTSSGKPAVGVEWPSEDNLAYKV